MTITEKIAIPTLPGAIAGVIAGYGFGLSGGSVSLAMLIPASAVWVYLQWREERLTSQEQSAESRGGAQT